MSIAKNNRDEAFKNNTDEASQVKDLQKSMSSIKHKFLVMSSKGGVGKTSVIVNLALALSMKGMKVGLMDLNYNSPEIHKLFGLELFSTGPGNRAVFLGFYITIFLWICTKRRQWKPLKSSWTGFVSNR